MGRLIYFEDHYPAIAQSLVRRRREPGSSLIPLQLALDEGDIEKCFAQVVRYGRCSIVPRANPADSGKILFLIRIADALEINRQLLEEADEDSPGVARRIDHIQMLENSQQSLVARAWERIGLEASHAGQTSHSGKGAPDPLVQ